MGGLSPFHILVLLVVALLVIGAIVAGVVAAIRASSKPNTPQAGWYPDKEGAMRWFDGQQWTEHTQ
jgi:hypothetical protein